MKSVRVKLQTSLRRYAPDTDGELSSDLGDGATVGDLLRDLGLTPGEVGLILVNGRLADCSLNLPSGATVEIFPIFGGG